MSLKKFTEYNKYSYFLNSLAKDLTKFYYSKLDKKFVITNKLKSKGYDPVTTSDKAFEKFIRLKISKTKTAHKAIGIKEIKDYLNNSIQIHELIEKISIKTRQYAKRQTTWARGNMMDWNKIDSAGLNKFLKKI